MALPHAQQPLAAAGKMHRGFVKLADSVWWGGLKQALDEVKGSASTVTITGHSLGGAAAAMLAARTQVCCSAIAVVAVAVCYYCCSCSCGCCCLGSQVSACVLETKDTAPCIHVPGPWWH